MGQPCVLVENFFNVRAFAAHVLAANEETDGVLTGQAYRVADGRRSILDYWTPITANAEATLSVTCDRPRGADMIALDRGHNLAGYRVIVEGSNDAFTTATTLFDQTLPTTVLNGAVVDDSLGVRTEEGAWLKRFPGQSFLAWRLRIPAMGVGILPQIVGAWLGQSWAPPYLKRPHAPNQVEFLAETSESQTGWLGREAGTPRRQGRILLELPDIQDYELARYHLEGHFAAKGRPMWLVQDDAQTEQAVLAIRAPGLLGFAAESGWFYPRAEIPWIEHQPYTPELV